MFVIKVKVCKLLYHTQIYKRKAEKEKRLLYIKAYQLLTYQFANFTHNSLKYIKLLLKRAINLYNQTNLTQKKLIKYLYISIGISNGGIGKSRKKLQQKQTYIPQYIYSYKY